MIPLTLLLISAAGATNASQGALLDFTATWCGPCQQMKPLVERLARQGYPIRQVNVDTNQALTRRFRVSGIPAFVLVVNGKEVARIVGVTSEKNLKNLLARIPKKQDIASETTSNAKSSKSIPARLVNGIKKGFRLPFTGGGKKRDSPPPVRDLKNAIVRAKTSSRNANSEYRPVNHDPFSASTRIRVRDNGGVNLGSGTVIDSKTGRTIILTCGHIFRGMTRDTTVEVDLFNNGKPQTFVGTVLKYDLTADLGLIAIPTSNPVPTSKLGDKASQVSRGTSLFSIGCGGGALPSKLPMRVTRLNPYSGPDCIECTEEPEQGRSGGGLFNAQGRIVGVCFAADPTDKRGLYTGLKPIHEMLTKAGLTLSTETSVASNARRSSGRQPAPTIDQAQLALMRAGLESKSTTNATARTSASALPNREVNRLKLIQEVFRNSSDADVVCIIRSKSKPQAKPRVVIINRASAKFAGYLTGEERNQARPVVRSARRVSWSRNQTTPTSLQTHRTAKTTEHGRYRRSRESR